MTPWSTARCSHWLGRIPRRPAGRPNDVVTELSRLMAPTMVVSLYGRAGGLVLMAAQASGRHSPSILKDLGSWEHVSFTLQACEAHHDERFINEVARHAGVSKQQAEALT